MTTEIFALLCSVGLLFLLNFSQSLQIVSENGPGYVWSKRDELPKASIFGGRIQRAKSNLIENLLIFAPLVLIASITNVSTNLTALGAVMFLVARILHALAYIIGVTHVRSPLWAISVVGMAMIAVAILNAL